MRTILASLFSFAVASAGEPVIVLDYIGGCTPLRVSNAPYLSIEADGTVRARTPYERGEPRIGRLKPTELKTLLAQLAPKVRPVGKLPTRALAVEDAATFVIRIGKRRVRQYALGHLAESLPKHARIQALWSVCRRLEQIYNMAMVGGQENARRLIARANAALKKAWPTAVRFTVDDMKAYRKRVTFWRAAGKRTILMTFLDGKLEVVQTR